MFDLDIPMVGRKARVDHMITSSRAWSFAMPGLQAGGLMCDFDKPHSEKHRNCAVTVMRLKCSSRVLTRANVMHAHVWPEENAKSR